MTNEEIVRRIQEQINVAIALRMMAQCYQRFYGVHPFTAYAQRRVDHLNNMAGLFAAHSLKLIATHKQAVTEWMEAKTK